jgi:hypothetical protein
VNASIEQRLEMLCEALIPVTLQALWLTASPAQMNSEEWRRMWRQLAREGTVNDRR